MKCTHVSQSTRTGKLGRRLCKTIKIKPDIHPQHNREVDEETSLLIGENSRYAQPNIYEPSLHPTKGMNLPDSIV